MERKQGYQSVANRKRIRNKKLKSQSFWTVVVITSTWLYRVIKEHREHEKLTCWVFGSNSKTLVGLLSTHSLFSSKVKLSINASLIWISGSYWNVTVAAGDHFAWSFPIPFLAIARSFSSCPFRSFTIKIPLPKYQPSQGLCKAKAGTLRLEVPCNIWCVSGETKISLAILKGKRQHNWRNNIFVINDTWG